MKNMNLTPMLKTRIVRINSIMPESEKIDEAAEILHKGGLVAFPTETVYGLGAVYNNPAAINRLYMVKKRPQGKPFTLHISDYEMIKLFDCEISAFAKTLMGKFWPGPLTIIMKTNNEKTTIAFRMPDCIISKELIRKVGLPIAAPSANLSGKKSPKCAEDVIKDLNGAIEMIIDGGPAKLGVDSTIVDASADPYVILREGAVKAAAIKKLWRKKSRV